MRSGPLAATIPRMTCAMLRIALVLTLASGLTAQPAPESVTAAEADAHLTQRVEPTTPPLARAAKIGGIVKLHIVISRSGDVSSVKVISGHPMLITAAVEAVRHWKYEPFEAEGGAAIVSTDVEVKFLEPMSKDESATRKFVPLVSECRMLISNHKYAEAEKKCREAVQASNRLPKDVLLERSDARSLLGDSLFLQHRVTEAIPVYQEALDLDKGYRKPDDANLASDYWSLGVAYAASGELAKADALYAVAVSTFEAAIQKLPSMKGNYTRRLARALNEYAQLKEAEGQTDAAKELRSRSAKLNP